VNRRDFLRHAALCPFLAKYVTQRPGSDPGYPGSDPSVRLVDVTAAAGIQFQHNNGAYGGKLLPETLGAGCAFLDYDGDGWQDILLVNGSDWPGHKRKTSMLKLYRNNRNGTFSDVTKTAGLDVEMYGMGVAVGDFNNDGFPDLLVTAVGQNRLFRNTGKGSFIDITRTSGLAGRSAFSTSALWFDFDRDGLLDLFVCNYVRWSIDHDVWCSNDGKQKSYCTPEAYRGDTCWLFRNRGNGSFEDVTASSGLFDTSSKSLGAAILDVDNDGWLDLFIANDTQPNKLYRNQRNGTFKEIGVESGVAFSTEGKARAGMGVDAAYLGNALVPTLATTNFDNEMIGLYRSSAPGAYEDVATRTGIGAPSRTTLGFGCLFADIDLDGSQDLVVTNGHIDETVRNIHGHVGYAQPPHLFLNDGNGNFRDVASAAGEAFAAPKVGRGLACGDFDRDGDVDLLLTTNGGPALLFRNDQSGGNRSIRLQLIGTKSNRDAIGAMVRVFHDGTFQTRMVKSGSSYLSQSELPVTFGLGRRDKVERIVVAWPSGRVEEFKDVAAGRAYHCTEGRGLLQE
jgi:enediyne biosynthesis protein E4